MSTRDDEGADVVTAKAVIGDGDLSQHGIFRHHGHAQRAQRRVQPHHRGSIGGGECSDEQRVRVLNGRVAHRDVPAEQDVTDVDIAIAGLEIPHPVAVTDSTNRRRAGIGVQGSGESLRTERGALAEEDEIARGDGGFVSVGREGEPTPIDHHRVVCGAGAVGDAGALACDPVREPGAAEGAFPRRDDAVVVQLVSFCPARGPPESLLP